MVILRHRFMRFYERLFLLMLGVWWGAGCAHTSRPLPPPGTLRGSTTAEATTVSNVDPTVSIQKSIRAAKSRKHQAGQPDAAMKENPDAGPSSAAQAPDIQNQVEDVRDKAVAEKQTVIEARRAEQLRREAEKQKRRDEMAAKKAAEKIARQEAAQAKVAAKKAADEEVARQREEQRQASEAPKREAAAEKQAAQEAREALKALPQATEGPVVGKESVSPASSDYVLQPGDEIDIQIYREPELSGTFRLNPAGDIRHSLAGSIPLAGKTLDEAEAFVAKRLDKDYLVNPRVIIKLVTTQSSQIVLLGEVKKPGVYPLPYGESMTLLQAIAGAGGFTELASPDRVRIVRKAADGRQVTMQIRVSELLRGKEGQQDISLEPNDVIMVPEVLF